LMQKEGYYFRLVQKQDRFSKDEASMSSSQHSKGGDVEIALDKSMITSTTPLSHSTTHIEFKDVVFAYPTRPKKRVFDGFNLKIESGQTLALVGYSGGGKSTVVGLIERFYDPDDGVVEYLGHDIRSLNVAWYRDQIGYVGQEPVLMNESIARNIAYGRPGASQSEIEEAARQANCHDFIQQFPDGYDTVVGERGTQMSGGQKQRIAIARALVKKPKVRGPVRPLVPACLMRHFLMRNFFLSVLTLSHSCAVGSNFRRSYQRS
jgi:ATP-binding cassette, subfamily B (MDR/TAP), member 1